MLYRLLADLVQKKSRPDRDPFLSARNGKWFTITYWAVIPGNATVPPIP